jgi:hypothetical protein
MFACDCVVAVSVETVIEQNCVALLHASELEQWRTQQHNSIGRADTTLQ